MEPNIFRYIWMHTRRDQIVIVICVLLSMIPYYMAFDLPKQIVNGPLQGEGFSDPTSTQPFMVLVFDLPIIGTIRLFEGIPLERVPLLMALSLTFLGLVIINGLFKYYINIQKGQMGERLLRRIRYELIDRILRFPPARFRQAKAGEISSMVKDEIEPLGGFAADAFTQPALLGGQALTALFFIFMQHFWLGMVAALMAGVQVAIIPRMRRRLIVLGRERQLTARELAGRVAEIVDGIHTIHTHDSTNWERADMVARLGRIFRIRYDIYQWKFLVKFLNNFIAQITPFLFYSIGGYLTIRGTLDVGQLVAVINAYKELPGPLKELIDWDLARQDMQVKYEQVVEQFEAEGLIDPARQDLDAAIPEGDFNPLLLQQVSVQSELGSKLLEDFTLGVEQGETVALVADSSGEAQVVGELIAGLFTPSLGRVMLGAHDLAELPERVTGRMIGYATAGTRLLSGSILDNVTYGLKRRPGMPPEDEPPHERSERGWREREARRAGNPVLHLDTDWIDYDAIQPPPQDDSVIGAICRVMEVVGLDQDLIAFAASTKVSRGLLPSIAPPVLDMRRNLRDRLRDQGLANAVLPFDPDTYNAEATVGENLLFGAPSDPDSSIRTIVAHPYFRETLIGMGLAQPLFDLGWRFASMTLELFSGMIDNPELLQWLTYMTREELPEYEQAIARTAIGGLNEAVLEDKVRFIRLAMSYVEPNYRMGLLTPELRAHLVEGRQRLTADMPTDLRGLLQPYHPDDYIAGGSIVENILFGKINRRFGNAEDRVAKTVRAVLMDAMANDRNLRDRIVEIGLAHDIGPDGRRLSQLQRQKLALARVLIRRSPYYVFNEPLAGVDPAYQEHLIRDILAFLSEQPSPPAVIWILANAPLAHHFGKVVRFSQGTIEKEISDLPSIEEKGLRNRHIAQ